MAESTIDTVAGKLTNDGQTIKQLVAATGKSQTSVRKACKQLVDNGTATVNDGQYSLTAATTSKQSADRDMASRRDGTVYDWIVAAGTDGLTTPEIGERLAANDWPVQPNGKGHNEYISCWRLRNAGQIVSGGKRRWFAADVDRTDAG